MLSLVIPCYNSSSYIDAHVEKLLGFLPAHFSEFEIILVDDGSPDDTAKHLRAWGEKDSRVSSIILPSNQGKGAAVKAGILAARGDYVLFTDADLPYDLPTIVEFIEVLKTESDVVLGDRYEEGSVPGQREHRTLLSNVFVLLANAVLRENVPDTQCGIKGFTKDAAMKIFREVTISRFCFDVEVIAIAQQQKFRIRSVPAKLVNQAESSVRVGRDGLQMCMDLVRIFFTRRLSWFV